MTILVAIRKAELPVPLVPSEHGNCIECNEEVWVSKETLMFLKNDYDYILCQHCQQIRLKIAVDKNMGVGG